MRQGVVDDGESYVVEALRRIAQDPAGWIGLRARNLADALSVPYGTSDLEGPSIKALFEEWIRRDRSIDGLQELMGSTGFGWKLLTYLFHGLAVVLGLVGVWALRSRWRQGYFVLAIIVYLVAVHAVLTILPRYLFPAEPFLWVLAGVGAQALLRRAGRAAC